MTQLPTGNDDANHPLPTTSGEHSGLRPADDRGEISLYDIWLILTRRWRLVLTLFVLSSLTAVVIAMALPKRYTFTSVIEIGQVAGTRLLESPEVVRLRLEKIIIPGARRQIYSADVSAAPQVKVDIIAGQGAIAISSAAPMKDQEKVQTLHDAIFNALSAQHKPLLEQEVNALLLPLQNSVPALVEQEQDLQQQLAHIAQPSGPNIKKSPEQDFLLALRLTDRRRELTDLRARLADRKREMESIRLASRDTRVVEVASQADRPLGPGRAVIVALGSMLGLLVGVIAAFAADFLIQARQAAQSGVR